MGLPRPCLYNNLESSLGSQALPASLIKLFKPNRLTNSLSVSSLPVNSSAHTYKSGLTTRAASSMYTPTWRGVEWQLSMRNPVKVFASDVTYVFMCSQSHGFDSGESPYRSLTQSPQTMTSRRRYAFEGGSAKLERGSAFQIQPLLATEYFAGSRSVFVLRL